MTSGAPIVVTERSLGGAVVVVIGAAVVEVVAGGSVVGTVVVEGIVAGAGGTVVAGGTETAVVCGTAVLEAALSGACAVSATGTVPVGSVVGELGSPSPPARTGDTLIATANSTASTTTSHVRRHLAVVEWSGCRERATMRSTVRIPSQRL